MDFKKQFEKYSIHQLLRIIDKPNDYQSDAIEAAKAIISNRQLSEEEIGIARDELNVEKQEHKENATKDKPTDVYKTVFSIVNPVNDGALVAEKAIRIISVVLCGIFLLQFYREYEMTFSLFDNVAEDWYIIFSALPPRH